MVKKIIILAGPTASGKSKAAVLLAQEKKECAIINADSMQVYKEIPIITAQPRDEEKGGIPHYLYGCIIAKENCSAGKWLELAKAQINECFRQKITPIMVGGTGLYIKALTEGISEIPEISTEVRDKVRKKMAEMGPDEFLSELSVFDKISAEKIEKGDRQRLARAMEVFLETGKPIHFFHEIKAPAFSDAEFVKLVLLPERDENRKNIKTRLDEMFENGVVEEIKKLKEMNLGLELPAMKAHGVREIISFINGESSREEAKEKTINMMSGYIKRQHTWFRNQMGDAKFFTNKEELFKIAR